MIAILWQLADGRWQIIQADQSTAGIRKTLDDARARAAELGLNVTTVIARD